MSDPGQVLLTPLDLSAINRLARELVQTLPRPLVIGLVGTLGAGKTTLVQAIARAAGVDSIDVTSPTFTLLQTYHGTFTIHHLDAYRVADEDEFLELGVEELFDDDHAWTVIEWADRVRGILPPETLWIEIGITENQSDRNMRLITTNRSTAEALEQIASTWKAST